MYRHRNVQQIELLLVCLACAWIATACSGSGSQPVTGYISYKPPVVPIIISLDTTGRITFRGISKSRLRPLSAHSGRERFRSGGLLQDPKHAHGATGW